MRLKIGNWSICIGLRVVSMEDRYGRFTGIAHHHAVGRFYGWGLWY